MSVPPSTAMSPALELPTRNMWVDYAKATGIMLVVYGHVARGLFSAHFAMDFSVFSTVDAIIYSFHMPLFFFLAGLFFLESLQKRGVKNLLLNKTDTIFYPYILWSVLQGSIEVFLGRWTNTRATFSQVFSLLWEPRDQFWFLYALFLVSIVAAFTYTLIGKKYLLAVVIAGIGMYLLRAHVENIPPLNFLFANFVYFSVGIAFKSMQKCTHRRAAHFALLSGLLFVLVQYLLHRDYPVISSVTQEATLLIALLGIAFVVSTCMWLSRWQIGLLSQIGRSSMTIYLAHILVGSGMRIILSTLFHIEDVHIHLLLGSLFAIILPVLLLRYAPQLHMAFLFENPCSLERWQQRSIRR